MDLSAWEPHQAGAVSLVGEPGARPLLGPGARCGRRIWMMMNGLGLAETLAGLRGLFQHARRLVGPGGQILADSTDVRVRMDREAARSGTLERPDGRYIGELHFQLVSRAGKVRRSASSTWIRKPFGAMLLRPPSLDTSRALVADVGPSGKLQRLPVDPRPTTERR